MEPLNYTQNLQTPFQALAQGYQVGSVVRDDQQQQAALLQAQQQQQQLAAARQAVIQNPTAINYSNLILTDPKSYQATQSAWQMRDTQQQQALVSDLGTLGSAIINKQPNIAADTLNKQADLIEQQTGSPTPESQSKRDLAKLVVAHPEAALGKILALADSHPAGKQVADGLRLQLTQDATVKKANADATSSQADATVKAATVPDLAAKPGIDNQKTEQDIAASQLAGRIAELNVGIAQANSETDRGRLTLERDKLVQEQTKAKQQQGQAAQGSLDSSSQALQTINDIKTHPGFDGFFTGPGTKWGAIWGKVPGTDRNALNNWVDSLRGQLGFDALMKAKSASPTGASGFGALSEGELKLISSLAAKLDPNADDFPKQLSTIEKYLNKAQSGVVASGNLPSRGTGAVVMTLPGVGTVREGDINDIMARYPGLSRSQALQKLQQLSSGGIVPAIPTR